ncbi:hypothetical protein BD626DRAFT_475342 [Schizophyllum amplum]|uniref:Transmembrane protein n=1 Tax=Schizophyllum amplum TaxID=97359 RepID=A0A550CYE7_9AGAR|nr:hypothetical protein BD626DRAFT_475342 [Auriculariopsis ampla]
MCGRSLDVPLRLIITMPVQGSSWSVTQVLPRALADWLEAAVYGIYTTLFFQYMMSRVKHGAGQTLAGRIYFAITILMFLVGTTCALLSVYGAANFSDLDGPAETKLADAVTTTSGLLAFVQMWLGDFLIVLRTHLVWDRNFRVTLVPWTLLAGSLFIIIFTATGVSGDMRQVSASLLIVVAENVITTGLLIYRLVSQHAESSRAGLHRFSRRSGSLIRIVFIISQSAGVYLMAMVLYTVFFYLRHPALLYMQVILPSVTGITLLAISIRAAGMRSGSAGNSTLTWTPPSEWRTSVHIAPAGLERRTTREEETEQEEAERYIETRYPGICIKEDSARNSLALSRYPSHRPSGAF